MKNFLFRLSCFMLINFGGLYIGAQLQGEGPSSQWYQDLNIAPWTPPGWVFGAAWTTIMICFSVCLAILIEQMEAKALVPVFLVQFILNVGWNPLFFRYHQVAGGVVVLLLLTVVVCLIAAKSFKHTPKASPLMLPYIAWLLVAISLNVYVLLNNGS